MHSEQLAKPVLKAICIPHSTATVSMMFAVVNQSCGVADNHDYECSFQVGRQVEDRGGREDGGEVQQRRGGRRQGVEVGQGGGEGRRRGPRSGRGERNRSCDIQKYDEMPGALLSHK